MRQINPPRKTQRNPVLRSCQRGNHYFTRTFSENAYEQATEALNPTMAITKKFATNKSQLFKKVFRDPSVTRNTLQKFDVYFSKNGSPTAAWHRPII
jgi:hypothetical protein